MFKDGIDQDPWSDDAIVVRQSEYQMMCHAELLYRDHADYKWVISEPLLVGSMAHVAFESLIKSDDPAKTLKYWALIPNVRKEILKFLKREEKLDEVSASILMGGQAKLESVAREVSNVATTWYHTWWVPWGSKMEILSIEEERRRVLGTSPTTGKLIVLRGAADLVVHRELWDWKTARYGWKDGKATARVQSPLYAWLYEDLLDGVDVDFHYLIWNRDKAYLDTRTVHVEQIQVDAALRAMYQFGLTQEAQAHVPTIVDSTWKGDKRGWWCQPKYCAAWEACEFKGLINDGRDLDEKIPLTW